MVNKTIKALIVIMSSFLVGYKERISVVWIIIFVVLFGFFLKL